MVIASSKNTVMTFFFLPKQHPLTLKDLPDGLFYTKDWVQSSIVQIPPRCAPVWCAYTGDWTDGGHSWTNPISGRVYETHPLGLTKQDGSFFDGFYEITAIEGLTFKVGEAWCSDTNQKIRVEKTDVRSIWNPFFQRYDPPCDCWLNRGKVKKEISSSSDRGSYMYFDKFTQCPHLFFDVYCNCGMRDNREHHTDSDSD
jgi:hypothetical protein